MHKWLSRCMILGTLSSTACSGSNSAATDRGSEAGGSVSAQQACTDLANAFCAQSNKCSQIAIASNYGDINTCMMRRLQNCMNVLAAAGSGATPMTTELCVAAYASYSCADFSSGNPPAACKPQPGMGGAGAACAFDQQCQSAFCQIPRGRECGTCSDSVPSAGASCANLVHCPSGLYCTKNSQICTTHASANQPCNEDTTCGYGLSCVGANATTATQGTCMPSVTTDGGACDRTQKTGAACEAAQNLYCSRSDTCAPYSSAPSGQPCKFVSDSGTLTYCTGGAQCLVLPSTAPTGTCTGPAQDGQPCDTSAGNPCVALGQCVGTVVDGGVRGMCVFVSAGSCVSADN
jgi:hypothetical protein